MLQSSAVNKIDALFLEGARHTDELTALGLSEWDCPFCEKPTVVEGADDMILHVKMDHPKKMRNFCTSHGLDHNEVLVRLGERPEKKEAISAKVEAPAPTPVKVDATPVAQKAVKSSVKPCACGYVGTDGKEAGAHKRQCVTWKMQNGKLDAPKLDDGASWEQRIDAALDAVLAKLGSSVDKATEIASDAASLYNKVEYATLKLQKITESLKKLEGYASLGIMANEYKSTLREKQGLEAVLEYAKLDDRYSLGQKAVDVVRAEALEERKVAVKACSDHNAGFQEEANKKANNWIDEQVARFDKLLKGTLRVQGAAGPLSLITQINWDVSKEVSALAKAKSYNLRQDEESICYQQAQIGLDKAGFPQSHVLEYRGTRKDVNDDGQVYETKGATFEATGVLPINAWTSKVTSILLYVRRVYRQSDHKVGTDAAMMTDEFEGLFGFNLQPQDPGSEIQRWRLGNGKQAKVTPKYDEGDTTMSKAIKDAGGAEVILRSKANGEPNMRQPKAGKNKRKQQGKGALSPERIMQIRSDDAKR